MDVPINDLFFHTASRQRVLSSGSGIGPEIGDMYSSNCNSNCAQYGGRFLCKVCVDRTVALALGKKQPLPELEKKVRFLQAYEPGPMSEHFRGDVSFVGCDLEPVYAHRFIMAGKSMVFRRMFDIDMQEKESGTVRVEDAVAPVLRSMVNYCYTADIEFTEDAPAEEVLKLAHKYDIDELKAVCESELSRGINKENLCNRLRLAHIYDAKKLDAVAAKFFKENFDEVYTSVVERLC
ncbi:hypothetical protein R1flu_014897 [Riccia fluitans]|uniref:BTB domain-containing protein n=1 Tax=Riccia fluitans TaxID=41844 RepID=A0ABD1YHD2_9MARC